LGNLGKPERSINENGITGLERIEKAESYGRLLGAKTRASGWTELELSRGGLKGAKTPVLAGTGVLEQALPKQRMERPKAEDPTIDG